jgi:hypothetical protein
MLVRLCQRINFGSIRELTVREGEPILAPPPIVVVDLKLDGEDPPRPERRLTDFELGREMTRLIERLDERGATAIELLEVRAGLPRRVILRVGVDAIVGIDGQEVCL